MPSKETLELIQTLVDYNWETERNDYRDNCGDGPEDNSRKGHIFEVLQKIQAWLNTQEN